MTPDKDKEKVKKYLTDILSTIEEILIFLSPENKVYKELTRKMKLGFSIEQIGIKGRKIIKQLNQFLKKEEIDSQLCDELKNFVFTHLSSFIDMLNLFFNKLAVEKKVFEKNKWEEENPITLLNASICLLKYNFRGLKNLLNKYFELGFKENLELRIVDEKDSIWDTTGMKYKEFPSDIERLREFTEVIFKDAPDEIKDDFVLKLQISEFIKNAIRHGNKFDKSKKVKVWYKFSSDMVKLIVEDEGEGFRELEKWNEVNRKRLNALKKGKLDEILKYAIFKGKGSTEEDGGNFLFSAVEYWDSGVIFSPKRNKLVVIKYFY